MRRWAAENGPFFVVACVLLVGGVGVAVAGRVADNTPLMGVGLGLLLMALLAIQLVVRRRNRQFEEEIASIHEVVEEARRHRGEDPHEPLS